MYYLSINGINSVVFDLLLGAAQGSNLGHVLYAIYVSPLFNIADFSVYADDTHIPRWDRSLEALITNMEKSLEVITKWLR